MPSSSLHCIGHSMESYKCPPSSPNPSPANFNTMRISRLQVQNFRSIRQLDIELPQICALVGPNNAGKSNILLAIQRVLERDWVTVKAFDEDDVYGRDPSTDVQIQLSFEPALSYTKFKGGDPAEIQTFSFEYTRYKIGEEKGQRRLEQK